MGPRVSDRIFRPFALDLKPPPLLILRVPRGCSLLGSWTSSSSLLSVFVVLGVQFSHGTHGSQESPTFHSDTETIKCVVPLSLFDPNLLCPLFIPTHRPCSESVWGLIDIYPASLCSGPWRTGRGSGHSTDTVLHPYRPLSSGRPR